MLTFAGTYVVKLMLRLGLGWGGVGWGGVGHVNVRWHLRPEVDATLGIRTLDALVEAKETK